MKMKAKKVGQQSPKDYVLNLISREKALNNVENGIVFPNLAIKTISAAKVYE